MNTLYSEIIFDNFKQKKRDLCLAFKTTNKMRFTSYEAGTKTASIT